MDEDLPGSPALLGPAVGEAAWILSKDPLAGPGPFSPAETGIPVSATVGIIAGSAKTGSGATTEAREVVAAVGEVGIGIGAGALLSVATFIGGDWLVARSGAASDGL